MGVIYVKLNSKACLKLDEYTDYGVKYGVHMDSLGLPYINIYSILKDNMIDFDGLDVGLGFVEHYAAKRYGAYSILWVSETSEKIILSLFTEPYSKDGKFIGRIIKKDVVFEARIDLPESSREEFDKKISQITSIGYIDENIKGEVEIYTDWNKTQSTNNKIDYDYYLKNDNGIYTIDYCLETVSRTCIYTPYEYEQSTKLYIPGKELFDAVNKELNKDNKRLNNLNITFSNAYPSVNTKRTLPVPIGMKTEKLHKDCLHFELNEPPKDYVSVQIVGLKNYFLVDYAQKHIRGIKPETNMIYPLTGEKNDLCGKKSRMAIPAGYVYRGFIKGTKEEILKVIDSLNSLSCSLQIGKYTQEGYGEVKIKLENLSEKIDKPVNLCNEFDLYCTSSLAIYSDKGIYTADINILTEKIEEILGVKDMLEVVTSNIDTENYFDINSNYTQGDTRVKCFKMGSSVRFKTKDGNPIDISKLSDCFIGDYNEYGFGEIYIMPSYKEYYRTFKSIDIDKCELMIPDDFESLREYNDFISEVLKQILKTKIMFLSFNDKQEGGEIESVPIEILQYMRDSYCKQVSDDELVKLYTGYYYNED